MLTFKFQDSITPLITTYYNGQGFIDTIFDISVLMLSPKICSCPNSIVGQVKTIRKYDFAFYFLSNTHDPKQRGNSSKIYLVLVLLNFFAIPTLLLEVLISDHQFLFYCCIDPFVNSFMIRFEFAITLLVGKHIGKIFFVALRFKIWRQVQNQVKFKLPSATIPTVGDIQQLLMIKLCCLHFKMMVVWKCWISKQTECNWVSHQWYHLGQSIFLCYKLSKYFYYVAFLRKSLCLLWRRSLSYRKQSIDSKSKSMDWFLYDRDFRHERVNGWQQWTFFANELINVWYTSDSLILI